MLETILVLLVTTYGNITLELRPDKAPVSVENFLQYVEAGHYNGTQFHRVIDGFMVQGGGFDAQFNQKPVRAPITNEADNGLKNVRGTIAMARTSDPQSATAQFFINTVDNGFLDFKNRTPQGWGYTVFGRVVEGMDVVDRIGRSRTTVRSIQGMPVRDVPAETVLIKEARVLKPAAKDAGKDAKAAQPAAAATP